MLALLPWLFTTAFAQETEPSILLQSAQEKYQLNLDGVAQQHDKQVAEMRLRLQRTLLQAQEKFQAQGDLKTLLKIRTLMDAPAKLDETLKPEQLPPSLDTLWDQYQRQLLLLKISHLEQQLNLTQSYGQYLEKLVKHLVRAGRIDDAIPYQNETQRVQALYDEMKASYRQLRPEPTPPPRPELPQHAGMLPKNLAPHCTLRFTFDKPEAAGRATSTPPQRIAAKLTGKTHWVADKVRKGVLELSGEGELQISASQIGKIPKDGFSLCLWIKPKVRLSDTTKSSILMQQGSWSQKKGYILMYQPVNSAGLQWLAMEKGRYKPLTVYMPASALEAGKWHHLAITHSDEMVRFYLNGKENRAMQMPGTYPQSNNEPFLLGSIFNGRIDEPMLFDRGLSAEEIQQVYEHTLLP